MDGIELTVTSENAKEYFLKTANTKHLLALVKKINGTCYCYDYITEITPIELINVSFMAKGGINYKIELTKDELKTELSTRKHIPNSIESRKLRQKLAKKYRKGFQGKKDYQK